MRERYWEIDFLRGIALLGMMLFHAAFDYAFFVSTENVNVYAGAWFWLARGVAALFILLAGISWTLHTHRKHDSARAREHEWKVYVRRGLWLITGGLLISLLSYIFFPAYAIWFGILHFLGFAYILGLPFLHRPRGARVVGVLVTLMGILFSTILHEQLPFWPILLPVSFPTFDYFSLFPWFGVFLLGIGIGHYFYPRGERKMTLPAWETNGGVRFFARLGKNSLLIYFIHQPILIGIILGIKFLLHV